jgi:hypothetical protein
MNTSSLPGTLSNEIAWLRAAAGHRLNVHFASGDQAAPAPPPPALEPGNAYADACAAATGGPQERLVLALALAPWLEPASLDIFLLQDQNTGRGFSEFGGITGQSHSGFLPSRETALFLLAEDMEQRLPLMRMFDAEAPLVRHELIAPGEHPTAPWLPLEPHPRFVARLLDKSGEQGHPFALPCA